MNKQNVRALKSNYKRSRDAGNLIEDGYKELLSPDGRKLKR